MKLSFSLLVVDDDPNSINEAILTLEDYLDDKGFALDRSDENNLSESKLKELVQSGGKNYDLVTVDYNLGQGAVNGAEAASRLRVGLPYTDIVFYSSDRGLDLYDTLAEQRVSGVFIAGRDELDSALASLADKVIGKAVDLNHMRGIAMAEVAEMDVLMEETLERVFQSEDSNIVDARERTIQRLREGIEENGKLLEDLYQQGGLPAVVGDSQVFPSAQKYRAVNRVARSLRRELADALATLRSYEEDIIKKRNRLAHVKEESSTDGQVFLRSLATGEGEVIDDNWMTDFRQSLRTQRAALAVVCEALDNHFGTAPTLDDSQKDQP